MDDSSRPLASPLGDAFHRQLVELSLDVLTVIDAGGVVRYQSPSFTDAFELRAEDTLGRAVLDYVHEADRPRVAAVLERVLREGREERLRLRFAHGRHGWRWIEAVGRRWEQDGARFTVVNSRDVDAAVVAERARERDNELLSKMLRATSEIISVTDVHTGRLIEVNEAWLEVTGYTREEAIGRTALELGIWGTPENREAMVAALRTNGGRLKDHAVTTFTRHGEPRELLITVEPLEVAEEPLILMVATDRTEANLTEAKLRQAQRMEADRKSTRLNSSHVCSSRMPSSA